MDSSSTLITERLTLRRWTSSDTPFLFDLYSRPEVQRYIGRTPRMMADVSEVAPLLERWEALRSGMQGVWGVFDDEQPCGVVLLKPIPASGNREPSGDVEIGWHFHPDSWGRGYATEAAAAVLVAGFESGLDRIVAVTHRENVASQAVCRRLGMTHLGLSDRYYDTTCELFEALR